MDRWCGDVGFGKTEVGPRVYRAVCPGSRQARSSARNSSAFGNSAQFAHTRRSHRRAGRLPRADAVLAAQHLRVLQKRMGSTSSSCRRS